MTEVLAKVGGHLGRLYPKSDESAVRKGLASILTEAHAVGVDPSTAEKLMESWEVQLERRSHEWMNIDAALVDLRRLLLGPQTARARVRHRLQRIAGFAFDHYVAVASLVAVLASGFYGLAYERFYQALDITPEQVGLSTTQIVARSAVGGVALVLVATFAFFVALMPIAPVRDDSRARGERGSWRGTAANAGLVLGGILSLFGLALILDTSLLYAGFFVGGAVGVFFSMSFRGQRKGPLVVPAPVPVDFRLDRYLSLLAAALPLGLIAIGIATVVEAGDLGHRASNGEAIRNPEMIGLPFLGVRAEPALISWRGDDPIAPRMPRCVFYLGAADGNAVLYNHRSVSTFQVPNRDVAIELRKHMTSCEAPINSRPPSVKWQVNGAAACGPGKWRSDWRPEFSFEWTMEGETITRRSEDSSPLLGISNLPGGSVVRCRVTAETPLGSDIAVSRGLVVPYPFWPPTGARGSAGFPGERPAPNQRFD